MTDIKLEHKFPIIKKFIKITLKFFPKSTIYLFGSRARDDFYKLSDYDILIITPSSHPQKTRILLKLGLQRYIQLETNISIHILLESKQQTTFKGNIKGNIVRWALYEGKIIYYPKGGIGYTPQT